MTGDTLYWTVCVLPPGECVYIVQILPDLFSLLLHIKQNKLQNVYNAGIPKYKWYKKTPGIVA